MADQQQRQLTPEQFQEFARMVGYEIAQERLERVTIQGNAILQDVGQLDVGELQNVEPATVSCVPWEPASGSR